MKKQSIKPKSTIARKASKLGDILDNKKKPKVLAAIIERYFQEEKAKVKPDPDYPQFVEAREFRLDQLRGNLIDLIETNEGVERLFRIVEGSQLSDNEKLNVVESVTQLSGSSETKEHFDRAMKIVLSCISLDDSIKYLKEMFMFTKLMSSIKFSFVLDTIEEKIKENMEKNQEK
jgi:hypothetical protein